jgi:hypothetical protein
MIFGFALITSTCVYVSALGGVARKNDEIMKRTALLYQGPGTGNAIWLRPSGRGAIVE